MANAAQASRAFDERNDDGLARHSQTIDRELVDLGMHPVDANFMGETRQRWVALDPAGKRRPIHVGQAPGPKNNVVRFVLAGPFSQDF